MLKSNQKIRNIVLFVLGISGILFWFIIGFPFANRNESYSWITQLETSSFWESCTRSFPSVMTFRPISQGISWVLYYAAGRNIFLVQLFNFIILILSFYLIIKKVEEKHVTSIFLLLFGLFFFTSYYYIFHVHGIFYSLLIFYITLLFSKSEIILKSNKANVFVLVITLVAIGIHTFSIIIFYLYLLVKVLANTKNRSKINVIYLLLATLFTLLILKTTSNYSAYLTLKSVFENIKNSFYSVELSGMLAPIVFLFSAISFYWIEDKKKIRNLLIFTTVIISVILYLIKIPLLFLLCTVIFAKLIIKKEYLLFSILLSLIIFPAVVKSGAPTKSAMLLTFLCIAEAIGLKKIENKLKYLKNYWYFLLIVMVLSISIITKLNYTIPFVTSLTSPIQGEREKSIQLDSIIKWYLASNYNECKLILISKPIPLNVRQLTFNRKTIPPTEQGYLDEFINYKKRSYFKNNIKCCLLVTFGNQSIINKKIIFQVSNVHAGDARVYY